MKAPPPAPPAQLKTPEAAASPCFLDRLADRPTQADFEISYRMRGVNLAECDGKRQLAVDTLEAEHRLLAQQEAIRAWRSRPWWLFWQKKPEGL